MGAIPIIPFPPAPISGRNRQEIIKRIVYV